MVELLAFEYGMKIEDIRSLTRRDIDELITAMVSRKSNYKREDKSVTVEESGDVLEKILKAEKRRFGV